MIRVHLNVGKPVFKLPPPAHVPAKVEKLEPPGARYVDSKEILHVAVAYNNPQRWKSRLAHIKNFIRDMKSLPNVRLYVAELVYGDRPFEVTSPHSPTDLQLRTRHELWHKENLLNLMIARFAPDWKYGAYCDGDFHFSRHDIGAETIHQLHRYDWVQMFSSYSNLSVDHKPTDTIQSFATNYLAGKLDDAALCRGSTYGHDAHGKLVTGGIGATGGAWAFRRESFDACGGLLDTCILGSADWHMAIALASGAGSDQRSSEVVKCTDGYAGAIQVWHRRAAAAVKRNIGVVNCHAIHYFHGPRDARGYGQRWKILSSFGFDPRTDIFRDSCGVWQLTPDKPGFRDAVRGYFKSRNEDALA